MWRFTIDVSNWDCRYGYITPSPFEFKGSELQYYYYNYAVHLTVNTRFEALGVL